MRILWLFGPPGVGKSVTAWELLSVLSARGESASYVDLDQLGMADPQPGDEHKASALVAVGRVHALRGATTLLVSGVLDPRQLEVYRRALAEFDLALVLLTVDEVELRQRVDARGPYAEDWSGVRADARRHEAARHGLPVVRSDEGNPSDVARRVLDAAHTLPADNSEPPTVAAGDGLGRAVLVTGTRVVGKSTVGWQAFALARQRGVPTAFLDLRQLGFHGPAGGPVDHELQAAVTGAVWRGLRRRGIELLLLNGTVDDPAQAASYAAHLDGTPLTIVRLTASASELAARARARSRGEMARLAGDDLVGADEEQLAQVVAEAVAAQESWPAGDEHVLATTEEAAADTARLVLDLCRTRSLP